MQGNIFKYNNPYWIFTSTCFQIYLFATSIILYKEKLLYADTAHFIGEIIGSGYNVTHRFICLFTRILPFASVQFGASIKATLLLYSINIALFFIIPFYIINYKMKNSGLALALIVFQGVFIWRSFYVPISELMYVNVAILLFIASLHYYNSKGIDPTKKIWLYILIFFISNSHPLTLITFFGSTMLLYKTEHYWVTRQQVIFSLSMLGMFIASSLFLHTQYEAEVTESGLSNLYSFKENYYNLRVMISTLFRSYYTFLILTIITFIFHIINRSFITIIGLISAIFINLSMVYVRFAGEDTISFSFLEIYFFPISLLISLSFVIILNNLATKRIRLSLYALIVSLILFQTVRVLKHSNFYKERLDLYTNLFNQMSKLNVEKAILPFYEAPMSTIVDFYTTPYETYLLSYLDSDTSNDGYMITYLLSDSVNIEHFENRADYIIYVPKDSFIHQSKYPYFKINASKYKTFTPNY